MREPADGEFAGLMRSKIAAGISTRLISVITAEEEQADRPRYAFLVGMAPMSCSNLAQIRRAVLCE